MTNTEKIHLRDEIDHRFSLSELQNLIFSLGIDYDNLPGPTKRDKIIELIEYCDRRNQFADLQAEFYNTLSRWGVKSDTSSPQTQPNNKAISGTPSHSSKITVLFLAANPKDTPQLRLDEEVRTIDEKLRLAQFRDKFDIKQQWATRPSDILDAMLRYKPDIVHFSGHGSKGGELIFENASGQPQPVNAEALGALFAARKGVRCVVMNACYADAHASAITKSVDCVVGMTRAVSDAAAINFASGFYRSLGEGLNVQEAFDLGNVQIMLDGGDEQKTPHLRTRKGVDANEVKFG